MTRQEFVKMLINSIYRATEGEGVFVGTPQIFVRLQGCKIGCLNCDSKDTWDFSPEYLKNIDEVIEVVQDLSGPYDTALKRVSITGGDPLDIKHSNSVMLLAKSLKSLGYFLNIEASGFRLHDEIFHTVDFISFDYKTPSTGVKGNLNLIKRLIQEFPGKFQIKSVCSDENDFRFVLEAFHSLRADLGMRPFEMNRIFTWCLTPAYNVGEAFPKERFQKVISLNEEQGGLFRVVGQQHKWVFGPDEKQV